MVIRDPTQCGYVHAYDSFGQLPPNTGRLVFRQEKNKKQAKLSVPRMRRLNYNGDVAVGCCHIQVEGKPLRRYNDIAARSIYT